jgi:hypothetical protein
MVTRTSQCSVPGSQFVFRFDSFVGTLDGGSMIGARSNMNLNTNRELRSEKREGAAA